MREVKLVDLRMPNFHVSWNVISSKSWNVISSELHSKLNLVRNPIYIDAINTVRGRMLWVP
jgi:hypothetical protein